MPTSPFLPLPAGLEIATVQTIDDLLTVHVVSTRMSSPCPLCFCPAQRRHSQYTRMVADLPCAGFRVQLMLHVRKFFCDRTDCPRKIFSERLPFFVEPWARMTMRLCQAIQAIGTASSAEVGARLAARLALQTSPTTILRRVMLLPLDSAGLVRVVGIDDWSFRRGRKFGTILVDLTSHKVIDLLPDRNTETAAAWMREHPEIEIVSRDRGEEYAAAARKGAPQAKSVADRFHITQNLGEALEPFLDRNKVCLRFAAEAKEAPQSQGQTAPPQPPTPGQIRPAPSKKAEQVRLAHRQARRERYEQAMALRAQGFKIADIASRLGVHRRTVERFLAAPSFPEKKRRRPERTQLEAYHPYLGEQWQAGVHNAAHLFRELTALGYTGSYASVYAYLTCLRTGSCLPATPVQPPVRQLSAKQVRFLFVRSPTDLEAEEQKDLETILSRSGELATVYRLVQRFQQMMHHRRAQLLDDWMQQVLDCPCPELHRFVTGLRQDYEAVKAALTYEWNNGVVEGHVNRLKLLKRLGYGRADLPLLRQRVLHAL